MVVELQVKDLDLPEDIGGAFDSTEATHRTNVEYHITAGNLRHQFHVRNSGQIYVNRPLDREDIDTYLLEVTATDGTFVSQTSVKITVSDVDGKCC